MTRFNDKAIPEPQACLRLALPDVGPVTPAWTAALVTLDDWARRCTAQNGLNGSEINSDGLHGAPDEVKAARDLVAASLMLTLPAALRHRIEEQHLWPELLYCRWAAPHTDNLFDKELFLSTVVGTGPCTYRVESLVPVITRHLDGRRRPRLGFDRHSLELARGAAFLLDPLVPHYASPEVPHQDCLLTLLQLRLPYRDSRERERWIRHLAPQRLQQTTIEED